MDVTSPDLGAASQDCRPRLPLRDQRSRQLLKWHQVPAALRPRRHENGTATSTLLLEVDFAAASTPVPKPVALSLFGMGLSGWLHGAPAPVGGGGGPDGRDGYTASVAAAGKLGLNRQTNRT